jgi:hypothetical protein
MQTSPLKPPAPKKGKKKARWFGKEERKEITLNDRVFNLKDTVQSKLYIFNYIMNIVVRVMFINLLVFLGIESKWKYL